MNYTTGTFLLEFGALTQLTGSQVFLQKALKALESLWAHRSKIGLVGGKEANGK